jgi:hypothetical protein
MAKERGELNVAQEHLDAAMALAVQARERLQRPSDGRHEIQLLLIQADLHQARHEEPARAAAVARALALSGGFDPRLQCSCHEWAALVALSSADLARAAESIEAMARLAGEFGIPQSAAIAQQTRGELFVQAGRWDDALRESQAGMEKFREMNHIFGMMVSRNALAEALWRQGNGDEAVALWTENAAALLSQDDAAGARAARLRIADVQSVSHHPEDASAALRAVRAELPALVQAGAMEGTTYALAARLAAWRVLDRGGDPAAAAQLALAEIELQQVLDGFADSAVRDRVAHDVPWHRDILEAVAGDRLKRSTQAAL